MEAIRSVNDHTLEARRLREMLARFQDGIDTVRLWIHPDLEVEGLSSDNFYSRQAPWRGGYAYEGMDKKAK